MLSNHEESSARLIELYDEVAGDETRRSHVMHSLSAIAKTAGDESVRKRLFAWLRARVYDESETDRARLQALRHVSADLVIRDAVDLERLVTKIASDKPVLAKRINGFLWEMF
jgi:hypothetical protein